MTQWKYEYKISSHVFSLLVTLAFIYLSRQSLQSLQLQVPFSSVISFVHRVFFSFSFPNVYKHIQISSVLIKIKLSQTWYTLQYCCYFSSLCYFLRVAICSLTLPLITYLCLVHFSSITWTKTQWLVFTVTDLLGTCLEFESNDNVLLNKCIKLPLWLFCHTTMKSFSLFCCVFSILSSVSFCPNI